MIKKLVLIGVLVYAVFNVFSTIGHIAEAHVFSVGDAFSVLGAMVIWSVFTLMAYDTFSNGDY